MIRLFRAPAVLPADKPPIHDGAVAVCRGRILACGPFDPLRKQFPDASLREFPSCAILPGFVNAHTHLELSHLHRRARYEGDFTNWVRRIMPGRLEGQANREQTLTDAAWQSIQAGVTAVGDICFEHRAWPVLANLPLRKVCFAEVFGRGAEISRPAEYLQTCIAETLQDEKLRLGISPHAPYSVGPELYRYAAKLAREHRLPLATHLAETPEETQFLLTGDGPWKKFMQDIGKWEDSFSAPGKTPVRYFLDLDLNAPFVLAHVNYLDAEELDGLARSSHSVAFCPRSHAFFGHPEHPVENMLRRGINVCVGTDSLASNESLSVLDELRFLKREYPRLPNAQILKMGTIAGAEALGWDHRIGSITAGKAADLVGITMSNPCQNPLEEMLASDAPVEFTMISGELIYSRT